MDWKYVVGNAATVFTIGVFFSGIQTCRKIISKKCTADISALPFVSGFVNCSLWLRYGVFVDDSVLIIVNLVGCCLQVLYMMCYGAFVAHKDTYLKQVIGAFTVLVLVFLCTSFGMASPETSMMISGFSACTATVFFISSPLASAFHVIKTKSVESLPFYMIFFSFIMAMLWVWYGILLDDIFVQIPNFLGAIASGLQLILYYKYYLPPNSFKDDVSAY